MAYQILANQTPSDGAIAMWNLISRLIAAGWSKLSDSDGTTYSAVGTQVTGSGSGANGLNNNLAWVRLRAGGAGGRELCLQFVGSANVWRIKYSPSAGFIGGSPSASQVPSATDERVLYGSGSDGSPTGTTLFHTGSQYRQQIICDNATPYGFAMITYLNGTGQTISCFIMDPMVANTYPVEDTDPVVFFIGYAYDILTTNFISSEGGSAPICIYKKGLAGESFVRVSGFTYNTAGGQVAPLGISTNAHNNKDDDFPLPYGRRSGLAAPTGYKGISSMMRWKGTVRNTGDTLNTKSRIVIGDLTFPWDGSTAPLI